jgi:flagellar assembly protein FliH
LSELVTLAAAVASVQRQGPEAEESRHALPSIVSEVPRTVRTTRPAPPVPAPRAVEPPHEEPQQELEEARAAGYQAGWEAAIRSEVEPQRARIEEEQAALRALTGSIQERLQRLSTELERDAFRFALAVAGRIVRAAVQEDREIVIREIREGVRRVVGVDSIILRINPADEPYVREHRETILSSADSIRQLVIEADQAIERGGCIIETASGTIDARIATQLKQIEAALFGSQASTGTP